MVKSPADDVDMEDFDNVVDYLVACEGQGYTIEGSDFEGRPCAYCGTTIEFVEMQRDPDSYVLWDVETMEPETGEKGPYYHRYYFCSESCKKDAQKEIAYEGGFDMHGEQDVIHEDQLEGMR